jgi:hypothetical protein
MFMLEYYYAEQLTRTLTQFHSQLTFATAKGIDG